MNKLKLKMSSGRNAAPEKLDPSIVKVREKVLALLADEPMGTAMATISDLLSETKDSEMRMGLLSARIKILRRRTEASRRNETPDKMDSIDNIPEPSTRRDLPENLRIDLDALKPVKTDPVFLKILQRSEEHTSELQSLDYLVCRLLLEKKKQNKSLWSSDIPPQALSAASTLYIKRSNPSAEFF